MARVKVGLEILQEQEGEQKRLGGRVAYLCHAASVTDDLSLGVFPLQKMLGKRLVKLFGPQHGLGTDVQDNMVETPSRHHPYFNLPVCSLYGETRSPTDEMLADVDTLVVDLQDVGTRVYTYISTLAATMRACAAKGVGVVVLDRPNPVGGVLIEGNMLQEKWHSFVGEVNVPMRHAMTMGELGHYILADEKLDLDYSVVTMEGWNRKDTWGDTDRTWVNPSPNLPTPWGALTFCGTVLFEGTNVSEGRGTTRPLEIVGAAGIEPFAFWEDISPDFRNWGFAGAVLRPMIFVPTFQKYAGRPCGGLHIHVTDTETFHSWRLGQWLLKHFRQRLGEAFAWSSPPYEYQFEGLPIDYINGSDRPRLWCESEGTKEQLIALENAGQERFQKLREQCLLYS